MIPAFMRFLFTGRSCSLILTLPCQYRESVKAGSKGVLNGHGPQYGAVVPVVHLVHSDPCLSTPFQILPKMCTRMDQGGPGGPGGP